MYHSNQIRSLHCSTCDVISKDVFKSYFDNNNYCLPCLIEAIKKHILKENY